MAQNLEIKIKLDNIKNMIELLKTLGAEYIDLLVQKDTYYSFDNGLLKLRCVNGKFELIKYKRDEINPDRWSNYELLFIKGDDVEGYLNSILNVEAVVEKERTLYLFKNTRIHLDRVKNLGDFLELETVVADSQEIAKDEFEFVADALNLDRDNQLKTSYRFLIEQV